MSNITFKEGSTLSNIKDYDIKQKPNQPPPPTEAPKPRTRCEFCGDISNKPHEFYCRLFGGMM